MHKLAHRLFALLLCVVIPEVLGQWLTQRIKLEPGWNAVHLEVKPEPGDCARVFAGQPVLSVWKWNRRFSTIQFTVDPNTLLPEDPDWLVWLPPSDPRAFLSRLGALQGNQAYLIKVAANAAPFTLELKGRVILPRTDWFPHGLNLVGFPVHPNTPPTFAEFFKFTPEIDTSKGYANELYRLDSRGVGERIVQPARDRMQRGAAYWIGCAQAPARLSALHLTPSSLDGLDFGSLLARKEYTVKNAHPTESRTVKLRQRPSEAPPATGGFPELAGPVPLAYLSRNASNVWAWGEFPEAGLSHTLAPGAEWRLWLGVRRRDFAPYAPQGTNGATYQSLLEISDGAESLLIRVPVLARRAATMLASVGGETGAHHEDEGLWVGSATLNQVNAPAYTGTALQGTPAAASFRLLVHVDAYGQARLLQRVVLAWDPTLTDAPHTNGTYALYADDQTVPTEATDVKRIDSVAFPVMAPVALTGSFSNALTGTVTVGFDAPTNPFLHRYHPMHDNKNWDFEAHPNAVETRTIERNLTLSFDAVTNASANPYYGVDQFTGVYQETLTGLRAQPVLVQGAFALQRISRINQLITLP
ncbi:MAG TPA: hypothetical protein PKM73_03335 [Verrucomicrobiota bacterium]|nr:hypothetical protein [Verrucomicrobiota bacterium]HNU50390.1 hypothetical protein [Verrucomicrobiota bacterium]